jgi:hypothetical protein
MIGYERSNETRNASEWIRDARTSCIISHNGKELLLVDLAVLVKVEFIDHGLTKGTAS